MARRPTAQMERHADTWLTDRVCIVEQTADIDVNPATGTIGTTITDENTYPALIQEISSDRQQNDGRTLGLADRMLYLSVSTLVDVGDRVIVVFCSDVSLQDREGTVTDVERDSLRARRRCTIRFDSGT